MKFTHIINPVKVSKSSDLFTAQPVTFETMRRAKAFAKDGMEISLVTAQYPEDREIIPDYFVKTPNLERSVLDIGIFSKKRKLPLIQDILNKAASYDASADYIIYTNVDIAVMPYFYDYIFDKIKSGHDSLIINRRVLKELDKDSYMYSDFGELHPGYDCFVFRRDLVSEFVFGNTVIGANWIGRIMFSNLILFSNSLEVVKNLHLTFHIGEDGAWLINDYSEFDLHNKNEVYASLNHLMKLTDNTNKLYSLKKVVEFMDDWGKAKPKIENKKIVKGGINRLKKQIKKLIFFFD